MIDQDFWQGKRVFLTGHTGFKGSWLTLWLLKLGAKVVGISKDIPTKPSLYEILNLKPRNGEHYVDYIQYLKNIHWGHINLKEIFRLKTVLFSMAIRLVMNQS